MTALPRRPRHRVADAARLPVAVKMPRAGRKARPRLMRASVRSLLAAVPDTGVRDAFETVQAAGPRSALVWTRARCPSARAARRTTGGTSCAACRGKRDAVGL